MRGCSIPVGFDIGPDGAARLTSFWSLLMNEWAFWQYLHNMFGACVTGAFFMAAVGAYYVLARKQEDYGRLFLEDRSHRSAGRFHHSAFPDR